MRRLTINVGIALALGWGLTLALLWLLVPSPSASLGIDSVEWLNGQSIPVIAAPALSEARAPDVNVRAERAEPYGLESSPEGALPFQHGDLSPCAAVITVCLSGMCDYSTIQAAVDAANAGAEIRVATGVYTGVSARASLTQVVYLSQTVVIRGGYTTTNWTTPNPISYPTTLDAEMQGRVLYISGDISPTIEGLRFTGGDAQGLGGDPWGNDAGGGIYVVTATAIISNNWVFSNTAAGGGGLYLYSSDATLSGNTVVSNTANNGGGLFLYSSAATLVNSVVADNRATAVGSGIYVRRSTPRLLHTTIARNSGGNGSGVHVTHYLSDCSTVALTNTILVSHTVGITVVAGNTAILTATLWHGNTTDWGGDGAIFTGTTNVQGDPGFVNPASGDYHITAGSAARNAGVDAGVTTDIDGEERPFGVGYDIGADEYWLCAPLTSVEITGPVTGAVGTAHTFTITIQPPTATLPIAYTWTPEPDSGQGMTGTIYSWPTTGTQTITVTAENCGRVVTATHTITIEALPPTCPRPLSDVSISGPTGGYADTVYTFTAIITPSDATEPITYTWTPEPDSGQGMTGTIYSWPATGTQVITVTAENCGGVVTATHTITIEALPPVCPRPLSDVGISGPTGGYTGTAYGFTAIITPSDATEPITYTWTPEPDSGQGMTGTIYSWPATGTQTITVTAENCGGVVTATHTITIEALPPACPRPLSDVSISGPTGGYADTVYTFTAVITPSDATEPITYTWTPEPDGGQGMTGTIYSWATTGAQVVTVTAENCGGVVTDVHTIVISASPAAELRVCLAGPPTCDYSSIQAAVDAANAGDEILVATGRYTGVSALAGVIQVVYLSKTVAIRGGYTTTNWTAPNPISYPTTLDAEMEGRVLYITGDISPTIEGLRFTGGDARGLSGGPGSPTDGGGGIYVITTTATIKDNWMFSNTAEYGGGVYAINAMFIISNNRVFSNTAEYGGGVYLYSCGANLSNNNVTGNRAHTFGGGLCLQNSPASLMGNTITANTANWGGGLRLDRSDATFSGNTVTTNTADYNGGGLYLYKSHDATLNGNTVVSNEAHYGGGFYLYYSDSSLSCNTISDNSAEDGGGLYLRYSDATLNGNTVLSNTANQSGGGLCLQESQAALEGNTVSGNGAIYGGGCVFYSAAATLSRNIVTTNSADCGGGLYLYASAAMLDGDTAWANSADYGGGLYLYASDATLINTVVADNRAHISGSGLYVWAGAPRLLHTTLARNGGGGGDGVGLSLASGSVALTNTILVGHTTGVHVAGGATATLESTLWGSGGWANTTDWTGAGTIYHGNNYTGGPTFVAPDAGDYHIAEISAAMNKGVNAGVSSDMDGDPRPVGGGFDLGADEWTMVDLSPSRKTVNPEQVGSGDVLTYTVILSNSGLTGSADTLFFDRIPPGATYVSGSAQTTAGTISDVGGIHWTGTVTPHQAITITFQATVSEQGCIKNVALITDQYGITTTLMATAWVDAKRIYLPLVLRDTTAE